MIKGQRSNFKNLTHIGPYHSIHDEPSQNDLQQGFINAIKIKNILLSTDYIHFFTSNIFNYRINKSEGLIQNLYDFFAILLKKEIFLHYSPQYGTSLWVHDLGFLKYSKIDDILQTKTFIYFEDYITETTTFIRYHYEFRYDHLFDYSFRINFVKKVVKDLLHFSESIGRKEIITSCIRCALNMLEIKFYL